MRTFAWALTAVLLAAVACSNEADRPPLSQGAPAGPLCERQKGVCTPGDKAKVRCGAGYVNTGIAAGCPQETGPTTCCLYTGDTRPDASTDAASTDASVDGSAIDAPVDAAPDTTTDAPAD